MPSRALGQFNISISKAALLSNRDALGGYGIEQRQIFYHADLAATVAAWDAYLNNAILEFIRSIGDISSPRLLLARELIAKLASDRLERSRSPNFNNARNALVLCTGYDPLVDWNIPRRRLSWQQVQTKLNEVLQVRHSFAHGFPLPTYPWMPARYGRPYLNKKTISDIRALIVHLSVRTDTGLTRVLRTSYGAAWA